MYDLLLFCIVYEVNVSAFFSLHYIAFIFSIFPFFPNGNILDFFIFLCYIIILSFNIFFK